jgi:hypothetical protein
VTQTLTTPLQTALAFAARGYKVFPVHSIVKRGDKMCCTCRDPECKSPGKHPLGRLVPRGLSDATTDLDKIRYWWASCPRANVGACTDKLLVIDTDPRHYGDQTCSALERENGEAPNTWRAITGGGGEHICFKMPPGVEIRNSSERLGPGVDVRAIGGYIVAAGSLHISGRTYAWNVDHHPTETRLASPPTWLLDLVIDRPLSSGGPFPTRPDRWLEKMQNGGIPEGGRNAFLASRVGKYMRHGLGGLEPYFMARAMNLTYCNPPLDEDEVLKIVDSICSCDTRRWAREV